MGEGPSARFSSAGACLDPHKAGFLVIVGGCNKNLEALDDMFYLQTGLGYDARFDQNVGMLSLKKQLKIKCQEQSHASSLYDKSLVRINMDHQGRGNFGLNTCQFNEGKMMFQARITESYPVGYTMETMIDGKVLRGVLFSNKRSSILPADQSFSRKRPAMSNGDQDNRSKISRTLIKDQANAVESKDSQLNGMEAGIDTISNPLGVNITTVAVAPHETETSVVTSDAKNQDASQLDMGTVNTVNTAPSSVPQVDEASLESRNAITIDDRANKTGLGES
jgi:hypothetical protein